MIGKLTYNCKLLMYYFLFLYKKRKIMNVGGWIGIGVLGVVLLIIIFLVIWFFVIKKKPSPSPLNYGFKCSGSNGCVACNEHDDPHLCVYSTDACGDGCPIEPPVQNKYKCQNNYCVPCSQGDGPDVCSFLTAECKLQGASQGSCQPMQQGAKCDGPNGQCVPCILGTDGCNYSSLDECNKIGCAPSKYYKCNKFGCCIECDPDKDAECHINLTDCLNNCKATVASYKLSPDKSQCLQCEVGEACNSNECMELEKCQASKSTDRYKCDNNGNCVKCDPSEGCTITDPKCGGQCIAKTQFYKCTGPDGCVACPIGSTDPECKFLSMEDCKNSSECKKYKCDFISGNCLECPSGMTGCQSLSECQNSCSVPPSQFDGTFCDNGECKYCLSTSQPKCNIGVPISECRKHCAGGFKCDSLSGGCITCSLDDPSCLFENNQDCVVTGCNALKPNSYNLFYTDPKTSKKSCLAIPTGSSYLYGYGLGNTNFVTMTDVDPKNPNKCPASINDDPNSGLVWPTDAIWKYDGQNLTWHSDKGYIHADEPLSAYDTQLCNVQSNINASSSSIDPTTDKIISDDWCKNNGSPINLYISSEGSIVDKNSGKYFSVSSKNPILQNEPDTNWSFL
jgi:hypothetical protein